MELDRVKTAVQAGLNGLVPKIGKYKYALIVLLVGILLLYAGGGARDRPEQEQSVPDGTEQAAFDLAAFEDELESKLAQIAGVGRVELIHSVDSEHLLRAIDAQADRTARMKVRCLRCRMEATENSRCA